MHNDLNPANFHVNDGQITLFDFDYCAYNWFINDISIALPLYSMYSNLYVHRDWEAKVTEFLSWYMGDMRKRTIWMKFGWNICPPVCRCRT